MRILALDMGTKRIGVAMSDELGITAQGLETIERESDERLVDQIRRYVAKYNVGEILVGLPLTMKGDLAEAGKAVLEIVALLNKNFRIPIKTYDERLTTKAAERLLIEADLSRRKRKQVVDKLAAQIMLQGYLEAKK